MSVRRGWLHPRLNQKGGLGPMNSNSTPSTKPVIDSAQLMLAGIAVKPHNGTQASRIEMQNSAADQPAMVGPSAIFHVAVNTVSCLLCALFQPLGGVLELRSRFSCRVVDGFAGLFGRAFFTAREQSECHQRGADELDIDWV